MNERTFVVVRIALRNVRRQARRSVLTASAMVLGIALLMFVRALEAGAHVMYVESAVRMGTGHVSLEHPDYAGSQDLGDRIPAERLELATDAISAATSLDERLAVFPRVTVGGLAQSASSSIPASIAGIDPALEAATSFVAENVVEGRFLEPGDRLEAVVGAGVAERLRVEIGSRVVLMAQDADGDLESQLVLVTGIFRTGIPEVDRGVVHIPLETARQWLAIGDDATALSAVLAEDRRTGQIALEVRARLEAAGVEPGTVAVRPWWEAMPDLHAGLQADAVQTYIMLLILLAIVALAVVNSVLMAVLYRTREFGVLRSLGLNRRSVGGMVMVEGSVLALVSGLAGMAVGLLVAFGVFRDGVDISGLFGEGDLAFAGAIVDPVIQPVVQTSDAAAIFLIVVAIGVLASLYPAWRATRIEPAEAMKTDD
jgi:ABC-type lipoprotein release transport system permease subunit